MKISKYDKIVTFFISFSILTLGCSKSFLDEKPSSDIIQPTTLDEFHLLLENIDATTYTNALSTLAADEYEYISYEDWQSARNATERNSYLWARDLFEEQENIDDWNKPYESIFYSNNILDGLDGIVVNQGNSARWEFIRGWALFNRAYAYYDLARNFSAVYDAETAPSALGLPIKLNPSIDDIVPRSTLEETYKRIIEDLAIATRLLDGSLSLNRNRPSKIACHALFARIYLSMRDYDKAEKHADSSLALHDNLIDYNTVNLTSATPFTIRNEELLYRSHTVLSYPSIVTVSANTYINVPTELIELYDANDLRLQVFFAQRPNGTYIRKRGYNGSGNYPFTGLATDELYLIKSECAARRGDIGTSLKFLNDLLIKRHKENEFEPVAVSNQEELMAKIILERRKELVWRGLRWDDLKRLNMEGANISLSRELNGQTYTLNPHDPRYVFPIPANEINFSGIEQNIR